MRWHHDFDLTAISDLLEHNRIDFGSAMWTIITGVYPRAGNPQHWLSKLGNRWIGLAPGQGDDLLRGAENCLGQRRRIEGGDDFRRGHQVARDIRRLSQDRGRRSHDQQSCTGKSSLSHVGSSQRFFRFSCFKRAGFYEKAREGGRSVTSAW